MELRAHLALFRPSQRVADCPPRLDQSPTRGRYVSLLRKTNQRRALSVQASSPSSTASLCPDVDLSWLLTITKRIAVERLARRKHGSMTSERRTS